MLGMGEGSMLSEWEGAKLGEGEKAKLGEPCLKVRLSQDRLPIFPVTKLSSIPPHLTKLGRGERLS